jgi:hypothetical protein
MTPYMLKLAQCVCANGFWRIGYNTELYELFSESDIIKTIKIGRLRWSGHVIRMLDDNPIKKLTPYKPDGCRTVGRPNLRWMVGIEDDLKALSLRRWRRNALELREWENVSKVAWAQTGL